MAINSKKKGNKNERELTKWWTSWTSLEFSRVPASGGLRWQKKDDISGDIICTDERKSRRFALTIEAKSYKDIKFEHLILGNKKVKILDFWQQAIEDGLRSDKIPILFMRYNGMPKQTWFVIINDCTYKIALSIGLVATSAHIVVKQKDYKFIILNSNDLANIDFNEFHKKLKIKKRNGRCKK